MTEQEIRDELTKVQKDIDWLEWATTDGQLRWEIRVAHEHHVAALRDAKARREQLKRMLASLS